MGHLTVRTMSKLSGVTAHTLRAWEKRYGALKPSRTQGGQRAYNVQDLERLRRLKNLTETGFSIGQIAHLPDERLIQMSLQHQGVKSEVSKVGESVKSILLPGVKGDTSPVSAHYEREPIENLLNDLAMFRLDEVYRGLTSARMRYGASDFVLKIAAPILSEIGILVNSGALSVSQEHAFSALLRDQIGLLIQSSRVPKVKDSIVFATSEGDLHEFGILLGQVLALSHGLSSHNLGASLPVDSLIFATNALKADHIVISFASLPPGEMKTPISEYLKRLSQSMPKHTTIFIGGRGVTQEVLNEVQDLCVRVESLQEFDNILKRIASHT